MGGRHFRVADAGLPCISDERRAFWVVIPPLFSLLPFLHNGFHSLPRLHPPVGLARNLSDCVGLQTLLYALLIGDRKPANRLTKSSQIMANGRRFCVCRRMCMSYALA